MTERANYIMSKMKEIAEFYLEQTEDRETTEAEIRYFTHELEIGINKLKELVK